MENENSTWKDILISKIWSEKYLIQNFPMLSETTRTHRGFHSKLDSAFLEQLVWLPEDKSPGKSKKKIWKLDNTLRTFFKNTK